MTIIIEICIGWILLVFLINAYRYRFDSKSINMLGMFVSIFATILFFSYVYNLILHPSPETTSFFIYISGAAIAFSVFDLLSVFAKKRTGLSWPILLSTLAIMVVFVAVGILCFEKAYAGFIANIATALSFSMIFVVKLAEFSRDYKKDK